MPYDEDLANRIRELLADQDAVTEKRMFGGLAFLVDGHMAVAASHKGGLLARVDPAESDQLVAVGGVERMVMRGKPMDGWLFVDAELVGDVDEVAPWVERGVAVAKAA